MNHTLLEGTFIKKDTGRWQGIYASQNYGTFYTVYAKLDLENNMAKGMHLYIVNYKGIIDIGFNDASTTIATDDALNLDKVLIVEFGIIGLSNLSESYLNFSNPIDSNNIDTIVFERLLHPLFGLNKAWNQHVFDTEFYFRNGTEDSPLPKSKSRPGYFDYEGEKANYDDEGIIAFSRNCHQSIIKAI